MYAGVEVEYAVSGDGVSGPTRRRFNRSEVFLLRRFFPFSMMTWNGFFYVTVCMDLGFKFSDRIDWVVSLACEDSDRRSFIAQGRV